MAFALGNIVQTFQAVGYHFFIFHEADFLGARAFHLIAFFCLNKKKLAAVRANLNDFFPVSIYNSFNHFGDEMAINKKPTPGFGMGSL